MIQVNSVSPTLLLLMASTISSGQMGFNGSLLGGVGVPTSTSIPSFIAPTYFHVGGDKLQKAQHSDVIEEIDDGQQTATAPRLAKVGGIFTSAGYQRPFQSQVDAINSLTNRTVTIQPESVVLQKHTPLEIVDAVCGRLHDVDALLLSGGSTDKWAWQFVAMVAGYLHLPVIGLHIAFPTFNANQAQDTTLLQISASLKDQTRALFDVLDSQGWHEFAILKTELPGHTEFISYVQTYLDQSDKWKLDSVIKFDVNANHYSTRKVRQLLRAIKAKAVILFCSTTDASWVFNMAESIGILEDNHVWIGFQSISSRVVNFPQAPEEYPLGLILLHFREAQYTIELALQDALSVLHEGLSVYLQQNNQVASPDLNNATNGCKDLASLRRLRADNAFDRFMKGFSKKNSMMKFGEDGFVENPLFAIVGLDKRGVFDRVGSWYNGTVTLERSLKELTQSLGNLLTPLPTSRHFNIVTIKEDPFVFVSEKDDTICMGKAVECKQLTDGPPGHIIKCCSGFCMELLLQLAKDLHFTYEVYLVNDGKFGKLSLTGKWNGVVGDIVAEKADMAVAPLTINEERYEYMDFSAPFVETGISVLVNRRKGSVSPSAFLAPLDVWSWLMIFLVCVHGMAFAIFVFEFLRPRVGRARRLFAGEEEHKFTVFSAIWLMWGMLFGGAVPADNPKGTTSKMTASVWAFFGLIFIASYTAKLTAFMILEEKRESITGINDPKFQNPTGSSPAFRFGTVPDGSTEKNIKRNYGSHMLDYMNQFNNDSPKAAAEALKQQELDAFIYDAAVLDWVAGKDPDCSLVTIGEGKIFAATGYGIGFPKGSPLKKEFDLEILRYRANGFLDELKAEWLRGICHQNSQMPDARSYPLDIENLAGAFYLLATAIGLSLIVLAAEHVYYRSVRPALLSRRIDCNGACSLISTGIHKSLDVGMGEGNGLDSHESLCEDCNDTSPADRNQVAMSETVTSDIALTLSRSPTQEALPMGDYLQGGGVVKDDDDGEGFVSPSGRVTTA
ncbi:PREDICTED: glutamate receptor ionotropic, NMDA 2A-like [Branchiostoma belcheri]|uniref:Glutamate receptor ionotropic, NMDA 2A-like n=1 Tax=Branchiostoma belcheri TaxID=7741 RepID=A0A6P4Y2W8_BRABE|nr:PREDICTED: glutamate receptor ionotropic, NMDA 2A-like [Branchiostoma belcheri]